MADVGAAPGGASRMASTARMAARTPSEAIERYAVVQPSWWSRAASGTALSS